MRLRLLIEGDFDPDTVDVLPIHIEHQSIVYVDMPDGYPALRGALVGALQIEGDGDAVGPLPPRRIDGER